MVHAAGGPFTVLVVGNSDQKQNLLTGLATLGGDTASNTGGAVVSVRDPSDPTGALQTVLFEDHPLPGNIDNRAVRELEAQYDAVVLVSRYNDVASLRSLVERYWPQVDGAMPNTPFLLCHTLAPEKATPSAVWHGLQNDFVELLNHIHRYCGCVTLPGSTDARVAWLPVVAAAINVITCPPHVLYDRRGKTLTLQGWRALRRAFWLLDRDVDGYLSDAEVLLWHNKLFGATSDDDIETLKQFLQDAQTGGAGGEASLVTNSGVTPAGFLSVSTAMLGDNRHKEVWRLLRDCGCGPDANPQHKAPPRCDRQTMLQLSHNAVQFFSSLYTSRKFPSQGDMWSFTPDAPWAGVPGLPNPKPSPQGTTSPVKPSKKNSPPPPMATTPVVELSLIDFLLLWRFTATVNPQAVTDFAYLWGYKGDAKMLFIKKKRRDARENESHFPNVLTCLLVGSPQCGKTDLIRRMVNLPPPADDAEDEPEDFTAIASVPHDGQDVAVVFREVSDSSINKVIQDSTFMSSVDMVLLCYDGNDPYSFSYVSERVPMLKKQTNLPCVVVMTKADLTVEDQETDVSPEVFCNEHELIWPPVITSTSEDSASVLRNEVDSLKLMVVDASMNADLCQSQRTPITRYIRRGVILAALGAGVFFGVRKVVRALRAGPLSTVLQPQS